MGFGIGILITGGSLYGGGTQDTYFNKGKFGRLFKNVSMFFSDIFVCMFFLIRGSQCSPPPMGFGIGTLNTGGNV